jgi:hypothetical protein
MPKQLIEFTLEDGETILVEVEPPTGGGARPIADGQNQIIKISGTLEQEFKKIIKPFAVASSTIISELQKIEKSADEIEFSDCNPSLENIFKPWKQAIGHQEMHVEKISEEDSYKYRYFSWKGIYIIPAAINMVAMENHFLLKDGILKFLKDPNFPK